MKARYFTVAAALMLSVVLVGCSAGKDDPTHSQDTRPSATMPGNVGNGGMMESASPNGGTMESAVPNDGTMGGGAGGTNDLNNDGTPDSTPGTSERVDGGDGIMDDIGDAAGDLIDDIGNGIENAGDAVKDGVGRAGRATRMR